MYCVLLKKILSRLRVGLMRGSYAGSYAHVLCGVLCAIFWHVLCKVLCAVLCWTKMATGVHFLRSFRPPSIYIYIYIYINEYIRVYVHIYIYIERDRYLQIRKGHNQTRSAHRSLMHSQKSYACLMQSLMRSYAELPPACGPNGVQNHARKKPEFRQCLMLSVMRDLRRIRPFKNRASEFTSYAPLTPHKTFVE